MRVVKTASLAAAAVLTAATFSAPLAAPAPFGSIVVFGTSLSHPGNAFAMWGVTNTPPDYLLDPFMPGVPPFTCQSPDEFLYWDGIHPSKGVHAILAKPQRLRCSNKRTVLDRGGGGTASVVA